MDRLHLEEKLGELQASMPLMLAQAEDPRDFWSAFADEANHLSFAIEAPEDKDYARACLTRMLQDFGLIAHRTPPDAEHSASVAL